VASLAERKTELPSRISAWQKWQKFTQQLIRSPEDHEAAYRSTVDPEYYQPPPTAANQGEPDESTTDDQD